jgi:hypothetical protein
LKDKALEKVKRLVDQNGGIDVSCECGSIKIEERDFLPLE